MLKLILVLSTLASFSAFAAEEKAVEVSCNYMNNKSRYLTADLYKNLKSGVVDRAVIELKEAKRNGKVLKTWKAVPDFSHPLILKLVGKNVVMEAFGDDVGAMSSITIDGVEKQLQCNIEYLLEE